MDATAAVSETSLKGGGRNGSRIFSNNPHSNEDDDDSCVPNSGRDSKIPAVHSRRSSV